MSNDKNEIVLGDVPQPVPLRIDFSTDFFSDIAGQPKRDPVDNPDTYGFISGRDFLLGNLGGLVSDNGVLSDKQKITFIGDDNTTEDKFLNNSKNVFSVNFNNCGCMDISQSRYNLSVDPNGVTTGMFIAFNRDDQGVVIGDDNQGIISNFRLIPGRETSTDNQLSGWQAVHFRMFEKRALSEDGKTLTVNLFIADKYSDGENQGKDKRGANITYTFTKGENGKFNELPDEVVTHVFKDPNREVSRVAFVPEFKDGVLIPREGTRDVSTVTMEDFRKVINYAGPAPVTHSGGVGIVSGSKSPVDIDVQPQVVKQRNLEFEQILKSMYGDEEKVNNNAVLPKKPQQLGKDGAVINKI